MSVSRIVHFSLVLLLGFAQAPVVSAGQWLEAARPMMGTEVRVELWAGDTARGRALQDAAFEEVARLDRMMNPLNAGSALSRINREAGDSPVPLSAELFQVLQRALHYSRLSGGAFDVSFASAGRLYDYRGETAPDAHLLEQARESIDYRDILIDPEARTIRFGRSAMALDLGGIAKGYAVDRAIEILSRGGITSAVVSAGGDSRILGDLGDRPRMIGIRHPRREGEFAAVIPLADTAISTSGDYERFFVRDGVRYHHILDPATGKSADTLQSVSIIAPRAVDSDALSTTVFVLGLEPGLALVNSLPGIDAVIVDSNGKLHYSEELLLNTTE